MSPTELKMQLIIHLQSKPGYGRGNVQVCFAMYCGFHFQFRRARDIPCVNENLKKKNNINIG
jgi:hypothetical protein